MHKLGTQPGAKLSLSDNVIPRKVIALISKTRIFISLKGRVRTLFFSKTSTHRLPITKRLLTTYNDMFDSFSGYGRLSTLTYTDTTISHMYTHCCTLVFPLLTQRDCPHRRYGPGHLTELEVTPVIFGSACLSVSRFAALRKN